MIRRGGSSAITGKGCLLVSNEWFYAEKNEVKGPYSAEQMLRFAAEQRISGKTPVIARGMTDWLPVSAAGLQAAPSSGDGNSHDTARQTIREAKNFIGSAAERISEMAGERGPVSLKLKDIFSEVFKKHTKEDGEKIFIAGTAYTTPEIGDISSEWPKPWLFFRFFLASMIVFGLLYLCAVGLNNPFAVPGLILVGSFAVPFTLVIFFFETNAPRNISIFNVVEMFFIGGAAAILLSLILYGIVPIQRLTLVSAVLVGIIEETGKLLIAAWFIRRLHVHYILNGLLIGAVVGAGFASFETAGYAYVLQTVAHIAPLDVIFERAWGALGTHTLWTAIAAAALVIVKQDRPLDSHHFTERRFLLFFGISVALHALWDMPLFTSDVKPIVLAATGWFIVFILINAGLKQLTRVIREETGLR